MAVVTDHPVDDEHAEVIDGRPDLEWGRQNFGVTQAKRYPPYVFSIRGASALVHKIARVDLHWWRVAGPGAHGLVKLKRPVMIATTICGQFFRLEPTTSRTCHVPSPEALLCGRCHGQLPTFGRKSPPAPLTRQEAHVKLGCVVNGY